MTEDTFRQLAETYGADIARWPPERQDGAHAVADQPWARRALAEAAEVDALFAVLPDDAVAPARVGRAIGRVTAELGDDRRALPQLLRRFALPWAGLATAGVMGVVVAIAVTTPAVDADRGATQLLAMTMSYSDPSWLADLGG